jgi:glutathione S-transferase
MNRLLNTATSFAATAVRLGFGTARATDCRAARQRLILYDFEACPFCRKVREALSHLGLEVEVRPTARGSVRREELRQRGGKVMVPYLLDPTTGVGLYESDQIVRYLYEHYGGGRVPLLQRLGPLNTVLSCVATALRPTRGSRVVSPLRQYPAALLVLYSRESNPLCRRVREALTELDLAYVCKNVPRGSPARDELAAGNGQQRVPLLIDPNTRETRNEADTIIAYLYRTYARS